MAIPFLVYARETSDIPTQAPTRQEITHALQQVPTRMAALGMAGQWAGPSPRVTKWQTILTTTTHVAWVYLLTGVARPEGFAQTLSDEVGAALVRDASHTLPLVAPTWNIQVQPYNETENGAQEWWESGAAATEALWVDHAPPLSGQVIPGAVSPVEDNHTGPNGLHRPPAEPNPLSALTWLVGLTVVGIGLIEFGPEIVAALRSRRAQPAHVPVQNPRRRRR